jgi:hypothetical protein
VLLLVTAIVAIPVLTMATGVPSWVGMNHGMMAGYSMPWTSGVGGLFGLMLGRAMMLLPWVLAIVAAVLLVNGFTGSGSGANRHAERADLSD